MISDDDLSITVDARIGLRVEVDHEHDDGRLVPMIEQPNRAELPLEGTAARVCYRCPDCGATVAVSAVADQAVAPLMALGTP